MNGHFAAVGNGPTAKHYEHGIQVIDEEKAFKFVPAATLSARRHLVTGAPHS
jgi:hypothetical protein